jgi:hypothetical protein
LALDKVLRIKNFEINREKSERMIEREKDKEIKKEMGREGER